MPTLPRGPAKYQCDGADCLETVVGVPHQWWKASVPEDQGRFNGRKRHYWLHSAECLLAFILKEGEAIVHPPARSCDDA
jgi:hypothetical protein